MSRVGVACAAGVVLLVSACGGGASAKQEAARFAIAYVDHARNGCCAKGLRAHDPKVVISKLDPRWATVWLHARDTTGYDMGAEELVLYRKPGGWTVSNGPGTNELGCGVPRNIEAELQLTAGNCKPPTELPGYVDCSYGSPTLRPSQLMVACGGGGLYITRLRWPHWARDYAIGTGVAHVNDCTPDCAAGRFHTYPVSLKLTKPQTCGKRRVLQFTRLTVTGLTPSGPPKGRFQTSCREP